MELLNNREIATSIWLIAFIGFILSKRPKLELMPIIRTFLHRKIWTVFVLAALYMGIFIYYTLEFQDWRWDLVKETVYWVFGAGIALLFTAATDFKIGSIIMDTVKLTVFIEFLANSYTFSLSVEMIIIPLIALLAMMSVVAENKPEHAKASRLINGLLLILGISLLYNSVNLIIKNFNDFASVESLKTFAISPILTFLFIPFLYLVALYAVYDSFMARINWKMEYKDRKLRNYVKLKSLTVFHLNLYKIKRLSPELVKQLAGVNNKEQARNLMVSINHLSIDTIA